MNKDTTKHIGTTIPKNQWKMLKVFCAEKDKKIADILRNAIDNFIEQNKEVAKFV